jgi:hypothetical protein
MDEVEESERRRRITGLFCLYGLALLALASIPLRCLATTARVSSLPTALGAGMGLALAWATRTRNPMQIYAALGLAFAAGTLFMMPLPTDGYPEPALWRGAPALFKSYPDMARFGAFVLMALFAFARFGAHAPDANDERAA